MLAGAESSGNNGSPQESLPSWIAACGAKACKIKHRLIWANFGHTGFIDRVRHRGDDRFGPPNRVDDIGYHEIRDMRNHLHQVASVGADELRDFDIWIEY